MPVSRCASIVDSAPIDLQELHNENFPVPTLRANAASAREQTVSLQSFGRFLLCLEKGC